jgi:glycerophosphoryl diester phosphodiesterase
MEMSKISAWLRTLLVTLPITSWAFGTLTPAFSKNGRFDLSGHRGTRGLCPENTLPAFAKALSIGVASLEMDAAVTADGVVVISHNQILNPDITRGPDGKWLEPHDKIPVRSVTYAQLQTYDVGRIRPGTEYAKAFSQQAPVDGTHIPPLSSVIELVRNSGQREVILSVEAKFDPNEPEYTLGPEPLAEILVQALRKGRFTRRAYIQSFEWRVLQIVQRIAPEIPTVYLTSAQADFDTLNIGQSIPSKWTAGFDINRYGGSVPDAIRAAGGRLWSPSFQDVDRAQVQRAHELGVKVLVWTVDERTDMTRLIDIGVDGIITDYPDRLRQVLRERGISLPSPAGKNSVEICK